jgi:hypothetical protein
LALPEPLVGGIFVDPEFPGNLSLGFALIRIDHTAFSAIKG